MSNQGEAMNSDNTQTSGVKAAASGPPPSPAPPRGPRIIVILAFLAAVAMALLAGAKWGQGIRGMFAKTGPAGTPQPASQPEQAKTQLYTCGMHPWVIMSKPGKCPICHMDLVPLDTEATAGRISIDPVISQSIGVRVAPVTLGPVNRVIRTVGTVDYNETLVRDVNLKISGWVEKLYVDYVGMAVRKGQPLLNIYSPELYSAQEEYLQAYRHSPASGPATKASGADVATWNTDLLAAARKRLEYFDISDEQIRQLEKAGRVEKTLTIRSPYDGLVINKTVYEGAKVDAGTQLYRIADLSNVWVMVTLYEYQLPYVQLGQQAVMTLPYLPGEKFTGKVAYIYPYVNKELRQIAVRLEFDNPGLTLKPGMFANIELRATLAKDRVLVPSEAVINTGQRQVAFVSLGNGRFDLRNVRVGVEAENGQVEILDGLKPGDMVVTSGEFLLDSEARLREAQEKMTIGELASRQKSPAALEGTAELASLPIDASKAITEMMDSYFAIGSKLSNDTIDDIAAPARKIAAGVDAMLKVDIPNAPHFWHEHTEAAEVRAKALEIIDAKDLVAARQVFADLSMAMEKLLKATGVPASYGSEVLELHCPMYREGQGGTWWLQQAGPTRNPYFGQSMLECNDKQVALPKSKVQ